MFIRLDNGDLLNTAYVTRVSRSRFVGKERWLVYGPAGEQLGTVTQFNETLLGDVTPNTTGVYGVVIVDLENGEIGVEKVPIIAWRLDEGSSTQPIPLFEAGYKGDQIKWFCCDGLFYAYDYAPVTSVDALLDIEREERRKKTATSANG